MRIRPFPIGAVNSTAAVVVKHGASERESVRSALTMKSAGKNLAGQVSGSEIPDAERPTRAK